MICTRGGRPRRPRRLPRVHNASSKNRVHYFEPFSESTTVSTPLGHPAVTVSFSVAEMLFPDTWPEIVPVNSCSVRQLTPGVGPEPAPENAPVALIFPA